jgi:Malectin domain/IPT/TIG domain
MFRLQVMRFYPMAWLLLFFNAIGTSEAVNLIIASFQSTSEGFTYLDNTFRNTTQSVYASGRYVPANWFGTGGYLQVDLGGIDNNPIVGMSGGWRIDFTLPQRATVQIKLYYEVNMGIDYEFDEFTQALCSVDGILVGSKPGIDYVGQIFGKYPALPASTISLNWVTLNPIDLNTGVHRLIVGAFNNRKTTISETSWVRFSNVEVTYTIARTKSPTRAPVRSPTKAPTKTPTKAPVRPPTKSPTKAPIRFPTRAPTKSPTKVPVRFSTRTPTKSPTKVPVRSPTRTPTKSPTKTPVRFPTRNPTKSPTKAPVRSPTRTPTKEPVRFPTKTPTKAPIRLLTASPTKSPTKAPVRFLSKSPTKAPLRLSTTIPTKSPSKSPVRFLTKTPTKAPIRVPTTIPTKSPTKTPVRFITKSPTKAPIQFQTRSPTKSPVKASTKTPTKAPAKVPTNAPTSSPIPSFALRVNCGSSNNYVDPNGFTWIADSYFGSKGGIYSGCPLAVSGTDMDELYCKERYFGWPTTPPFIYDIPVPRAATYFVRLHFAEIYYRTVDSRVFAVWVNGKLILSALDVVAEVGYAAALVIPVKVQVTGQSVTIELVPNKENPKISGIEVIAVSDDAKLPTSAPVKVTFEPVKVPVPIPVLAPSNAPPIFKLRINAGSDKDYLDPNGNTWEADKYFGNNGGVYSLCPRAIASTGMDDLYCKERFFNKWQHPQPFQYIIPVPRQAVYSVRMHFAEIVYTAAGQRVFEVWVNGRQIMAALDIFAEVGYATNFILSVDAKVTDNKVTIEFIPNKENPKISGIAIIELPNYVTPPTSAPVTAPFNLLINCGGLGFLESSGVRRWESDQYSIGGNTYVDTSNDINGTLDDTLYQSERYGEFKYEIPVPTGSYEVVLHFAELYWQGIGQRLFNVKLENKLIFSNVDIVALGGGKRLQAFTLESVAIISDGYVSLEFTNSNPKIDMPKLSGIEINFLQPHLAHSVANGPYVCTDIFNAGIATTQVDGTGLEVVEWTWKEGNKVVGVGPTPNITLPVGEHTITLSIKDNGNNEATDTTTLTVHPFGFPAVLSVTPSIGSIAGGQLVTIQGSGFTDTASVTQVKFGLITLSDSAITIVDQFTIRVRTPTAVIGSPVSVSVETPLATSNSVTYTYEASSPITFRTDILIDNIASPTSVAFGPDGKLYVGTLYGILARLTLDDTFTTVISSVSATVTPYRAILGIAFNPLQTEGLSDVYITSSYFFHGESLSSSGTSINGCIKKISGANLDVVVDIVTGLPVSDHDHGRYN